MICKFPRRLDTSHPLHVSSITSDFESILQICVDEEAMRRMEMTRVRVVVILQTRLDADEDDSDRYRVVDDDQSKQRGETQGQEKSWVSVHLPRSTEVSKKRVYYQICICSGFSNI